MSHHVLKLRARALYKDLHRLGRDYEPSYRFNERLRKCFPAQAIEDPEKLKAACDKAEFIKKEVLALYSLRKYRHLKRSYYADDD